MKSKHMVYMYVAIRTVPSAYVVIHPFPGSHWPEIVTPAALGRGSVRQVRERERVGLLYHEGEDQNGRWWERWEERQSTMTWTKQLFWTHADERVSRIVDGYFSIGPHVLSDRLMDAKPMAEAPRNWPIRIERHGRVEEFAGTPTVFTLYKAWQLTLLYNQC